MTCNVVVLASGSGTLCQALIDAVVEHQRRFYGIGLGRGDVLVTAGATEALAATMLAYLEPGDEVVVFEPYYDAYAAVAGLAGATIVPIPLAPPVMKATRPSSCSMLLSLSHMPPAIGFAVRPPSSCYSSRNCPKSGASSTRSGVAPSTHTEEG